MKTLQTIKKPQLKSFFDPYLRHLVQARPKETS
jgi:hypothetical protein